MIALFLAAHLFAADQAEQSKAYAAWVAKLLVIPDDAVRRSLQPIDEKTFLTIQLTWQETEPCSLPKWPCRGKWEVSLPERQLPPAVFAYRTGALGCDRPWPLVYVAVDRGGRPVWLGTTRDFRIAGLPTTSADGTYDFTESVMRDADYTFDIPRGIHAVDLRIYAPVPCRSGECRLLRSGTVRIPLVPPVLP